jgi:predicted Fe-Mo cluster-binding NifX family protein
MQSTQEEGTMKLCIPINEDNGLDSTVCAHFGSASNFLIVETTNRTMTVVANTNVHHGHGMCQPLRLFEGMELDCIAVGGIGRGALMKLQAGGVEVLLSKEKTVGATLDALEAGLLQQVDPSSACGGHGHQGSCSH